MSQKNFKIFLLISMKIFILLLIATALFLTPAIAQWEFISIFPPDTLKGGNGCQGLAVDGEGKIWIQPYSWTDRIQTHQGAYQPCRCLYVFYPDGIPASFSPIKTLTVSGIIDTLWNNGRGLQTDHNGNILASYYDVLYRINYKTGEGMNKVCPKAGMTLTAAAVDVNGNIVVGPVIPGNPIFMIDADFNVLGTAVDATTGYSRTIELSKDGNTIYWTSYTNLKVQVFKRQDEFSPFDAKYIQS